MVFGAWVQRRAAHLGIEHVLTAPRSPWQNAYAERVSGSLRRDCLDQVMVFNEGHLRRLLTSSFHSSHRWRTQLALAMDCPEARPVQPPEQGAVVAFPVVGGLHHHYERVAARAPGVGTSQARAVCVFGKHGWLKHHPRFHLHFTPTSSSWLNLVERWFREITQKRIRRGSFASVKELLAAIQEYHDEYNRAPKHFVWTKSADMILAKIESCKAAIVTQH